MRFKDSLLGFAIGDAVGVPVEFQGRETLKNNPILDMEEYGTHYQPIGTWSDDTSMTIATIDSIITKNNVDYNDIMNNFNLWVKEAKYTATDKCFDVGNTCRCAIYSFNGNNALECGRNEIVANGNGALMRILPIVYYCYYYKMSDLEIYDHIKKISSLTHAHEISVLGCYIYTMYVINLLNNYDKVESYRRLSEIDYSMFSDESLQVYNRILGKRIYKYRLREIKSSGYVVDTLEAVLWSIINTKNYKDSILTAVNMGDDTDTVAAITGSIAGIIYGIDNIPSKWKENLKKKDYLIELADNYEKFLKMNKR